MKTPSDEGEVRTAVSLRDLSLYFLKLGAVGFGGPIALAGYMQRDLQQDRKWITPDEFSDGLAIAETMPGPLAAQLAMWIGLIRHGVLGATLAGILFVLPPFVVVVAVAAAYVAFSGMPQIRALFHGIAPAAIAIIALAAWGLSKATNGRDARQWGLSAILLVITAVTRAELAWLFILAGVIGSIVYAPPWQHRKEPPSGGSLPGLLALPIGAFPTLASATVAAGTLVVLTLFFLKASLFTFGSGLAIVPFLHEGVVVEQRWLDESQFLDAVAIGIITPGPVVITAAFIGYLVAGLAGAVVASFAVFFPVWVFDVIVGRVFLPHRDNPQVRGFVKGATAAAVGAIGGAAIILGLDAVTDIVSAAIFLVALVILYFKKLKEPYVIALAGAAGLLVSWVG